MQQGMQQHPAGTTRGAKYRNRRGIPLTSQASTFLDSTQTPPDRGSFQAPHKKLGGELDPAQRGEFNPIALYIPVFRRLVEAA
jgi:hypothetical protein